MRGAGVAVAAGRAAPGEEARKGLRGCDAREGCSDFTLVP